MISKYARVGRTQIICSVALLIGTRIMGISVKEYKVNSPSLYKCMQVTTVNTNSG